jgi:Pin2-interacting protein X1
MALTDATAMAEVLGIAPSASNSAAISTAATSTEETPNTSPPPTSGALEEIEKLSTSSKSVMDYFKEKLLAKSNAASGSLPPTAVDTEDEEAPRRGLGSSSVANLDHGDSLLPRRGLGLGFASGSSAAAHPLATVTFSGSSESNRDIDGDSLPANRKKFKNVESTAPRVSAAIEEDTTADAQHVVDDDATARKAAKRARKEAKRLAKQGHTAAADADGADPVPEKPSKEERRRRRKERANADMDD